MKRIITILHIVYLSTISYAQSENEFHELINRSFENHIISIEKLIDDKTVANDYLEKIIFVKDNVPSNFEFSRKLRKKYNLQFFNPKDFNRNELRTGIVIFQMYPLILRNDTISITIGNVVFFKKGKKTFLEYGKLDTTTNYKYSCVKKEWELMNILNKGI